MKGQHTNKSHHAAAATDVFACTERKGPREKKTGREEGVRARDRGESRKGSHTVRSFWFLTARMLHGGPVGINHFWRKKGTTRKRRREKKKRGGPNPDTRLSHLLQSQAVLKKRAPGRESPEK